MSEANNEGKPIDQKLEDRITHLLSEWLNDNAPIGEERYRSPAKAVIKEVSFIVASFKKYSIIGL